jgi:stage VI sporulation protein D
LQNANNENNAQKEIEKYEELYNRTLEQNYQPYVNQQYQQAPFAYNQNQEQFYQNPFPQVNQENNFESPNDARQTPPYYADYYQAQVEQQEAPPPPELPIVEIKADPVGKKEVKEVKEEVSEARSVKSDNLLSSLFTGEGREDSYTKLKLYLAQNGDTIESVAKKYNLQTQQLNRVNNLNDEFLSEGQIIYIPVTAIKQ